jgi:hypothetical protein
VDSWKTNKPDRVVKNGSNHYFSYNNKGNLTTNPIHNTQLLSFNYRNLPTYLRQSGNNIYYHYDENGMRVKKQTPSGTEYYIRDHTGRELAVLGTNNRVKYLNLFGNGLIGRIDVRWDSTFVKDPGIENKSFGSMSENITENSSGGYWVYNRIDERSYYGKDHLGNIRLVIPGGNLQYWVQVTKVGALKTTAEFLGILGFGASMGFDFYDYSQNRISGTQLGINIGINVLAFVNMPSGAGFYLYDKIVGVEKTLDNFAKTIKQNSDLGIPIPAPGTGW